MLRLIGFEWKKIFGKRSILLALILLSLIDLVKINGVYRENSYLYQTAAEKADWNSVHWSLYEEYSGEITSQQIQKLLTQFRPIEEQVAEMTASTRLDNPNTMTGSLYGDYNLMRKYFVLPMEEFHSYAQKALTVSNTAKENASFYRSHGNEYEARKNALIYHQFSGREINSFAYTELFNYYLHYDFSTALTLLLCLFGLVSVFVREKESDMEGVLLVNPHGGRATAGAKIVASSLYVAGVSLWFSALDFLGFVLAFHTSEGSTLPIFAITNFAASPLRMSLGMFAIVSALVKALGVWTIGMIVLLIAKKGKNALFPFLCALLFCLGLVVLGTNSANSSWIWAKVFNPFTLLQNRILFRKAEFVNVLGFPVPSFVAAIVVALLLGFILASVIVIFADQNNLRRKRGAEV